MDQRTRHGVGLLALMTILPLAGIVAGLVQGDGRVAVASVALLALSIPAPVLYLRGKRWAPLLGLYTSGTGILVMFLNAVRLGNMDWLVAIVPYGAAAWLFHKEHRSVAPAETPPEGKPETQQEAFAHWLRENCEAIVVAFIMALVIRCFCIEVFKIPSGSMEPTLLGDATSEHLSSCRFSKYHENSPSGDRIMVTKYYYIFEDVQRFDVVVFKFPLELSRNFIKRVVGVPNEEFVVWRGNIYARSLSDPDPRHRIQRKPVATQMSLWIDPDRNKPTYLSDADVFDQSWTTPKRSSLDVQGGRLRTPAGETRFRYEGQIRSSTSDHGYDHLPVGDVMVTFEVLPDPGTRVLGRIENELGPFEFDLGEEGATITHRDQVHRIAGAKLKAGDAAKVMFMVYDGQAVVSIDGRAYDPYIAQTYYDESILSPRAIVEFGAKGTATFSKLRIGRDIHYTGEAPGIDGEIRDNIAEGYHEKLVIRTGPDEYIMMGDNVGNSHDSRKWKKRTYHLKDGRSIVFESQADKSTEPREKKEFAERVGLKEIPDYYIQSDVRGIPWHFNEDELRKRQADEEPFIFVKREYIIGKGFWVWWPPGRWFRMIR